MTSPCEPLGGGPVGSSTGPPPAWWWQGLPGGRQRDLLPLPLLSTGFDSSAPKSRRSRHRLGRRLCENERINRLSCGLSALASGSLAAPSVGDTRVLRSVGEAEVRGQRDALLHLR